MGNQTQGTVRQAVKSIDTHAHLYLETFQNDIEQVTQRAQAVLNNVILPNIDVHTLKALWNLVERWQGFYLPAIGLHPCSIKQKSDLAQFSSLQAFIDQHRNQVIAIGECGLDLYWDASTLSLQIEALQEQIRWAKYYKLPLILHCRNAFAPLLEQIEKHQDGTLKGVFHCFTGNEEDLKRVIDVGFYVGIGGILTYKKSHLPKLLKKIPIDRLLFETDAPYLSPHPYRGKRNESAYVIYTIKHAASLLDYTTETLMQKNWENAVRLFKL